MNTTLKGNLFEEKAYDIIMSALKEGQLGLLPARSLGFRKKAYPSHDGGGGIIFDLSIEVWQEGAERYTWLCLIECKDYANRKVERGDIVKFVGDVDSVAGKNVKGIFISTTKLQKSAYAYAKAKGLMVINIDLDNQPNIILHNSKRQKDNLFRDSPVSSFNYKIDELAAISGYYDKIKELPKENLDNTIYQFLSNLLTSDIQWKQPDARVEGLQYLSKTIIEKLTTDIINEFDSNIISEHNPIPMERFISYFTNKFGIEVISNHIIPAVKGKKINGYYDRQRKEIHVDSSLAGTAKFAFVVAHEIGHFFLHSKLSMDQLTYDGQKDSEYSKTLGKHVLVNEKHWIEWQANQFAAALLMPHACLLFNLVYYQIKHGINGNRGKIYLDYQFCNKVVYQNIMLLFTEAFNVSVTALEYRLTDLDILIFGRGASFSRIGNASKARQARSLSDIIQTWLSSFE